MEDDNETATVPQDFVNAAQDALMWLQWFKRHNAIQCILKGSVTPEVRQENIDRLARTVAELERVTNELPWVPTET